MRCAASKLLAIAVASVVVAAATRASAEDELSRARTRAPVEIESIVPGLPSGSDESGFLGSLRIFVASPTSSHLRVREFNDHGDSLAFADRLGIPVVGEITLSAGWRFDRDDALVASLGWLFAWGGTSIKDDIEFNATSIQGGTHLDSRPTWFSIELRYQRALFRFGDGDRGFVALDVGVRFDYLNWEFKSVTIRPGAAPGDQPVEDYYKQALPIPLFGLSARVPIAEGFDLIGSARGFRLNHVSSGRKEGGIVYWSQSAVDVVIGAAWRASDRLELSVGYRFLYIDMAGESAEDGNLVTLNAHGGVVGAALLF